MNPIEITPEMLKTAGFLEFKTGSPTGALDFTVVDLMINGTLTRQWSLDKDAPAKLAAMILPHDLFARVEPYR